MYAAFTVVQTDPDKRDGAGVQMMTKARQILEAELIPQIKQAPGFVKGTWFGDDATTGHGLVVFDTQEQAQQATQELNSMIIDGVSVVTSAVYEVHAEA